MQTEEKMIHSAGAIDVQCPLAYLSEDGKKEILPYYDPSRKAEIVGIYSPSAKQVVGLKNFGGSNWHNSWEQEEKAGVKGIKALLPSKDAVGGNGKSLFYKDKVDFNDTAAFLRSQRIDADDWKGNWYWCREAYDSDHAYYFGMSSGSVSYHAKDNYTGYTRCVLNW